MNRRIWTISVGLAALAALIAVPAAMAAYTSAKLEMTQTATGVVVKASLDPNDDPTARVGIFAPTGTQLTTSQAPGAVLGPVRAIVKALDLAGADLPLEGQLVVAAPGQIPAATRRCMHRWRHAARDLGHGADGGRTDAAGSDVPRRRPADRRQRPARPSSRSASRRPTCPSERRAERRSARRSTAPSSRSTASSAGWPPERGSPRGCPTRPEPARRTPQVPSSRPPRSHPVLLSIAAEDLRHAARSSAEPSRRAVSHAPVRPSRSSAEPRRRGSRRASASVSERTGGSRRSSQSGRSSARTQPRPAERRRTCARRYSR